MILRRRNLTLLLLAGAVALLSSCISTTAGTAADVTDRSATLTATITSTEPATVTYSFTYARSPREGWRYTEERTIEVGAGTTEVREPVDGLQPDSTYYFELCATEEAGEPVCSGAGAFETK